MTPVPPIVILNGRKNAVREKRETGQWHRVKNLWFWWHLTAFLTTVTDPSRSLRMTINVPPIMTPFLPIVILNGRKNALWEKREAAIGHKVKNLLLCWQFTNFLTTAASLRHRFGVTLIVSRHSERWQECCSRKTGNRTVTQSEESMILMTSYRFPHHRYRAFTFASDDV